MSNQNLFHSNFCKALGIGCMALSLLNGCSLTGNRASGSTDEIVSSDMEATNGENGKPTSARDSMARGKGNGSGSYVDPRVAKASEPAVENRPSMQQPASIAGLATEPTGIRAGRGSIFSAAPPVMPASAPGSADAPDDGPMPAMLPRRNFDATTASVFSAPPQATAACGADADGNLISC